MAILVLTISMCATAMRTRKGMCGQPHQLESFSSSLKSPAHLPISDKARTEKLKTDLPDWPEPDDSYESFEAWGKHLFYSNDNYRWRGYQLGDYGGQWHYNTTSMCPSRTLESLRPATSTLHLKPKAERGSPCAPFLVSCMYYILILLLFHGCLFMIN